MKIIAGILLCCFFNVVVIPQVFAETIYSDPAASIEAVKLIEQSRTEFSQSQIKKIHDYQDSGRVMFWTGVGLLAVYVASIMTSQGVTSSFAFVFGTPIVAFGLAWYGLAQTTGANRYEEMLYNESIKQKF